MTINKYMIKNYEEKNSIKLLISEIKSALNNKLYLAALTMSLIIPDILGQLEYGIKDNLYYSKWFDKYVRNIMGLTVNEIKQSFSDNDVNENRFDGEKCYKLRCSLFHRVATDIEKRTNITEFVIQLSDEPFVRGIYYCNDYDYNNIVINEDVTVSEDCKITKMYISANEISRGIVNAAEEYVSKNKDIVNGLNKIKINSIGGIVPSTLLSRSI